MTDGRPGDVRTLTAGDTELTIEPSLGLVATSLSVAGDEFLRFDERAARGGHTSGIPLLAPWANRLRGPGYDVDGVTVAVVGAPGVHLDDAGLPIHGTMVGRDGWVVGEPVRRSTGVTLVSTFDAAACDEMMASFPFPHTITVEHRLEPGSLTIVTTMAATGDRSVPVSFGWHPYVCLPGGDRSGWSLELPDRFHLELDALQLPTGVETFEPALCLALADRSFDDGYRLASEDPFVLTDGVRRVQLHLGAGFTHAQVYAPVASNLVALEPMTAATDSLTRGTTSFVAPGGRYSATFTISIS